MINDELYSTALGFVQMINNLLTDATQVRRTCVTSVNQSFIICTKPNAEKYSNNFEELNANFTPIINRIQTRFILKSIINKFIFD